MTTTAAAIYEHGILRPLAPLPLLEGARVEVTVTMTDDASPSQAAGVCSASELLREVAGLPVESDDDGFSAQHHDKVLYGSSGGPS